MTERAQLQAASVSISTESTVGGPVVPAKIVRPKEAAVPAGAALLTWISASDQFAGVCH